MPQVGRYCNGDQFVRSPVRIASVSPACDTVSRVASDTGLSENIIRNGIMIDYGKNAGDGGPYYQGYTSLRTSGSVGMPYQDAMNIRTPIDFGSGEEGSVTMATLRDDVVPNDPGRPMTAATAILTVVAQEPPAGAFRPACCAPSKISHWIEDDLDLSLLAAHPLPNTPINPQSILANIRFKQQVEQSLNPLGERIRSSLNNPAGSYPARDVCRLVAEAVTLMSMNINEVTKRNLAVSIAQNAIDILERVKQGGRFGIQQAGTGGVAQTGAKLTLLTAGILFGDAEMLEWGNWAEHHVFGEDVQMSYIDEWMLARNSDYTSVDMGMPEWIQNRYIDPGAGRRSLTASGYRAINTSWQPAAAMAYYLLPSAIMEHHGCPAFFDYCDRLMERDAYVDGGPSKWMRSLSSTDQPSAFCKAVWDMYRVSEGPALWDWP